jgi:hypothetical protein
MAHAVQFFDVSSSARLTLKDELHWTPAENLPHAYFL